MRFRILTAAIAVCAAACSGSSSDDVVDSRDAGVRDLGPRQGTIEQLDVEPEEIVHGLNSEATYGDNALMRQTSGGDYVIAYGVVPAGDPKQEVHYATRDGANSWTTELVGRPAEQVQDAPGTLVGLGFDLVGDVPHIVYAGGDDDDNMLSPFPTDLELRTKNGATWSSQILVDTSGEANGTCITGQNYCNFGNVVGTHAAIKANGAQYAVVYRDTHGGFADLDFGQADVELYLSNGGASQVDSERSGGPFADVAFKNDGSVVMAYNLARPDPFEDRVGVWVAYGTPGNYELRRVSSSETTSRTSLAVASDGTIYLAFFHLDARDLVLATSSDGGDTWTTEAVDESGATGLHPSLQLDAQDQPVIAYTYCGRTSNRDCPGELGEDSEVRLARRENGAWQLYTVYDGGGAGGVGLFNSLVIDADGKVAIAFQDATFRDLVFVKER